MVHEKSVPALVPIHSFWYAKKARSLPGSTAPGYRNFLHDMIVR
ncbi:MAG: hypothetical protein WB404_04555 [Methanoregula sp.]